MESGDVRIPVLHRWLPPTRAPERITARPARAAHLLAFAHWIEAELARGAFSSASEVARLLGVSRERVSRLRRLTMLAPDIQEELLFLEMVDRREDVCVKWLTDKVARHLDWEEQRRVWREGPRRRRRRRRRPPCVAEALAVLQEPRRANGAASSSQMPAHVE